MAYTIITFLVPFLVLAGYARYFFAIQKGEAKPHRVTRIVLFCSMLLSTLSFYVAGATVSLLAAVPLLIGSGVILVLSFKYGVGGWETIDVICLVLGIAGLVFWQVHNNPDYGIYFGIGAQALGMIPTFVKTYRSPESEDFLFWFLHASAGAIALVFAPKTHFSQFVLPVYMIANNSTVLILILRKKIYRI